MQDGHEAGGSGGRVVRFRPRAGNEAWVTKQQLADHLQVSVKTIERWIAEGMPCLRRKRFLRFRLSACEAWLEDKR